MPNMPFKKCMFCYFLPSPYNLCFSDLHLTKKTPPKRLPNNLYKLYEKEIINQEQYNKTKK